MRVAVIGRGVVGSAVERLFDGRGSVISWDLLDATPYPEVDIAECDFAVICVPTPATASGEADLSAVHSALARLPDVPVLLRSTVPPGTTERLAKEFGKEICFWPEFTGESAYFNPYFPSEISSVPFVILGGERPITRWFIDQLLPILGPTKTYFQCSGTEAELIKYAENTFFATKITFVNEFRRICEAFETDWHAVREGWLLDPRVGPMHTAVFADDPGFGGKCLPKDLNALIAAANDVGYRPTFLEQVRDSNELFRNPPPQL